MVPEDRGCLYYLQIALFVTGIVFVTVELPVIFVLAPMGLVLCTTDG